MCAAVKRDVQLHRFARLSAVFKTDLVKLTTDIATLRLRRQQQEEQVQLLLEQESVTVSPCQTELQLTYENSPHEEKLDHPNNSNNPKLNDRDNGELEEVILNQPDHLNHTSINKPKSVGSLITAGHGSNGPGAGVMSNVVYPGHGTGGILPSSLRPFLSPFTTLNNSIHPNNPTHPTHPNNPTHPILTRQLLIVITLNLYQVFLNFLWPWQSPNDPNSPND